MTKGKRTKPMMLVGIDLSLNHGAFTSINAQGKIADAAWFVTNKPRELVAEDHGLVRLWTLPKKRKLHREPYDLIRLKAWKAFVEHWLEFNLTRLRRGEIICAIEGYAFAAQSSSTYQIGGLGEMVKMMLVEKHIPLRIYDPMSIKLYVTGKGNTKAENVHDAAEERFHCHLESGGDARGDVLTALSIAKLLRIEWKLRAGTASLERLHKDIVHIFKKSTRKMPVPILDRDWIGWSEKDFEA
jgi:Holliday junction resolvasome RuvABC endonuclease subunit